MKRSGPDRDALLVSAALILQVLFFLPLEIFVNNVIEFNVRPHYIGAVFLVASLFGLAALYPAARWEPLRALALLLAVGIFAESRMLFAVAGHQPFDGKLIDWSALHPWSVLELWILLAAGAAGAAVLIRPGLDKVAQPAALFILVFQGVGLAVGVASNFDQLAAMTKHHWDSPPYDSDFYRLSRKRNVVQIVVDHTQGSLVHEILTSDPQRYTKTLEGFTLFTQASGKYPGTYPAIPHLMTGLSPDVGDRVVDSVPFTHESIRRNLRRRSIVTLLKENDFKTFGFQVSSLFCEGSYDACISGDVFSGQPMFTLRERLARDCLKTMDVALFRISPVAIRPYVYNDEQWLMRSWVKERTPSGVLDLFIDQVDTDSREGSYNYFHHQGGHPPIQFDADCRFLETQKWRHGPTKAQVTCSLRQLERLAAALKGKGVFDQTLIVMLGDHGSQWPTPLMEWRTGTVVAPRIISSANPLLLIKPLNARQPLRFSNAPAEIGDVPATIAVAFGLKHDFPGKSLLELTEDEVRERVYLWFKPDPGVFQSEALPRTSPYRIRGNLFNQYHWIPPYLNEVGGAPTGMRVDDPRFSEFSQGFSDLAADGKTRWLEGALGRAYLSAPKGRKVSLVLRCGLAPTVMDQSLSILVNGAPAAELAGSDLPVEVGTIRVPLAADLALKPVNVVELQARETAQPDGGRRLVSLLVSYIGLE